MKLNILATILLVSGLICVGLVLTAKQNGTNSTEPSVVLVDKTPAIPEEKEMPLPEGKRKITKLKIKASRTIFLEGEMSENMFGYVARLKKLNQENSRDPIYIVITSPGGSVLMGAAFLSAIEGSKAPVYTVCQIMCASMAANTLQFGKKRYASDRTIIMYHPAFGGMEGDVDRMASQVMAVKRYINKMEAYEAKRMGLSFKDYKALAATELWVDSEDALKRGFIDDIIDLEIEQDQLLVPAFRGQEENNNKKTNIVPKYLFESVKWIK